MARAGGFAEDLKLRADIVRIIGEHVRLQKSGQQNWKGLCPFHNEKSPSFSVHETRQFYHCFGCGESGDVYKFFQKLNNCSFPEAVKIVAQKMGVDIPAGAFGGGDGVPSSLKAALIELHEKATAFFQEQLKTPAAASAREYLNSRGISDAMVTQFRIGYAPESGNTLRELMRKSADEAALRQSGLFSFKEEDKGIGALYSRFRNRITFPISDEQGRVIAFGARTMETGDKAGPKYLNSPETPLYSKGRVLYNLDKAKEAIRSLDYSIVVEGYMDCISVYTAGLKNVIASSGTAFTEAQVRLLGRFSKNIAVNFDPDAAGAAATERSLALLVEEEFNIKVVTLEPGLDPDLTIRRKGVEAYQDALKRAPKYFHYLIDRAMAQGPRTPEAKVKAMNFLLPHIQRVPSRIARDEMAQEAAQRLGIDSAVMRQEMRSAAVNRTRQVNAQTSGANMVISPAEKIILQALIAVPNPEYAEVVAHLKETLKNELPHEGWASAGILDVLLQTDSASLADPLSLEWNETDKRNLAAVLLETPADHVPEVDMLVKAVSALRRPHLERKLRQLQTRIDDAQQKSDATELARLSQEKLEMKRLLDQASKSGI